MTTGFLLLRWTGRCLRCGAAVRRRWWQRGILTPLPLCTAGTRGICSPEGWRR